MRQIGCVPPGGSNILPQYSSEELRDIQMQDSDLRPLFRWLDAESDLTQAEVHLSSHATRQMWRHRAQLKLIDGVLFYVWQETSHTRDLFIVPQKFNSNSNSNSKGLYCHTKQHILHTNTMVIRYNF